MSSADWARKYGILDMLIDFSQQARRLGATTSGFLLLALTLSVSDLPASGIYSFENADGVRVFTSVPQTPSPASTSTIRVRPTGAAPAPSDLANSRRLYVYSDTDGSRLLSDERQQTAGLQLMAIFGRATASLSCNREENATMRDGGTPHDPLIRAEASRFQLDPVLIKSIIWVESCFDPRAVSPVGAQGLMQLMPNTAAELGVTDPFSPEANLRGGIAYLAELMRRFDNHLERALAAYNAGPGAVVSHNGIPPYRETQEYVRRVLAHYAKHLNQ
jgi:soluble lytic murein transglycosylase-like protein